MGRTIGLLGGIGSGKSTVARLLQQRGATLLDADEEARAAVERPEIRAALLQRFGQDLLLPDGRLDREELARRAFASPEQTTALNALVHPEVRRALAARRAAAGPGLLVLDVPLLLESPLADWVDVWVYVDAPAAVRELRVAGRGWSPGERERREALQAGLPAKRARARHTLENSGTIKDLERQVDALLKQIGVA